MDIVSKFLKEYEQKRINSELDLEKRKQKLYSLIPRLSEIEKELNSFAIFTAKNILNNPKNSNLEKLNEKIELLKAEKIEILKRNNLTLDYLKPFYDCSICKDTGFVLDKNYNSHMCNCLKQKILDHAYNNSNMQNLNFENFNTFNPIIFSNKVDFEKYKQNISPRNNIYNIKEKAIEFIKDFDKKDTKNLLFTGNTGLGKSFISNCIAAELLKNNKTVLYQTSPILLENVIEYKMNKNKNTENNILKTALSVDLLIIDDLGTEPINSMTLSELFTILNTRLLNSNTKTLISTNLGINEIFKFYEERIGSRIAGYYDIYYFFGEDLRLKQKL